MDSKNEMDNRAVNEFVESLLRVIVGVDFHFAFNIVSWVVCTRSVCVGIPY